MDKDLLSNISENSLLNNNTNTNNSHQWSDDKIDNKPTYMEGNFNENTPLPVLNDENIVFDPSNNGSGNAMNTNGM